jgi:O-antigen/teichoic acid export membrane protein
VGAQLQRPLLPRPHRGQEDVGRYSLGVRIASAMVLLLVAFRMAWPAFAYSIEDEREARRTYAFVLTYLLYVSCWLSLALGVLAPWIVRVLARDEAFWPGADVVAPLAFAGALWGAYTVVAIGIGRLRRTQFNWVVTGSAALVSVVLNLLLIPEYGIRGAAAASLTAFTVMFVAMAVYSQRLYPVPYQWRRVCTVILTAAALTVVGRLVDRLEVSIVLILAYPLVLFAVGFYLPFERARLVRVLVPPGVAERGQAEEAPAQSGLEERVVEERVHEDRHECEPEAERRAAREAA